MTDWAIITGEYPPQPGGVSDYTRRIAEGLIDSGKEVVVFAPRCDGSGPDDAPFVNRLPDHFGVRGLWSLRQALQRHRPRHILLQYTPHAFGWKAMNLPLCLLLSWKGLFGRADVRVMFHEVALPYGRRPLVNALAGAQRVMARTLVAGAKRIYLSTLSWKPLLTVGAGGREHRWLPIPATIPTSTSEAAVAAVRRSVTEGDLEAEVVGHFGTFGDAIAPLLNESLSLLQKTRPQMRCLLVGRGAERFKSNARPESRDRMIVAEDLAGKDVAAHLKACDVMIQPYPDGVSTRRSTTMAGLACGVPVVTNLGVLSEPLWRSHAPALVASQPEAAEIASLADGLLDDRDEMDRLGAAGKDRYESQFALKHSIEALLHDD
jgi:glycosyltransferase involved in cell wall biosynthesis